MSSAEPPDGAPPPVAAYEMTALRAYRVEAQGHIVALEVATPTGDIELSTPAHVLTAAIQGLVQADASAEMMRAEAQGRILNRQAPQAVGQPEVHLATTGDVVLVFRARQTGPIAIALTPHQADHLRRRLSDAADRSPPSPTRN